jgi:hypothetical protein
VRGLISWFWQLPCFVIPCVLGFTELCYLFLLPDFKAVNVLLYVVTVPLVLIIVVKCYSSLVVSGLLTNECNLYSLFYFYYLFIYIYF